MNLLENEEQIQKSKKAKIIMIIIAVVIVLLLVLCGVLAVRIGSIENKTLKLVVDNKNMEFDSNMFTFDENGLLYINIKKFAEMVGYHTYNGDFKTKYSEDTTNCYISNGTDITTSDEVASYCLNSMTMYKQVQETNNGESYDYEYYEMDAPVKSENNILYATEQGMEIGTNCLISYNQSNNTISVNTLDYIVSRYSAAFPDAVINTEGSKAKFNNKKALKDNLVVIMSEDKHYGVCKGDGTEIIGTKYASIEYREGSREFTVTTDEGKMGILSADGKTKIEPNYTEIKQISKDLNYYLVKNNNKYGVINQNGNTVIFLEFDQIGIDEKNFPADNIENPYILFDYCIPVKQNNKWGIFNINGETVVPIEYKTIGCVNGASRDIVSNNAVIIPQYEAIIMQNADNKYTILSSQGTTYVPAVLDAVYSVTTSGNTKYFMTFTMEQEQDGKMVDVQQTYDVDTYFTEQEIVPQYQSPQINTNTTANETVVDQNTVVATDTNTVATTPAQ